MPWVRCAFGNVKMKPHDFLLPTHYKRIQSFFALLLNRIQSRFASTFILLVSSSTKYRLYLRPLHQNTDCIFVLFNRTQSGIVSQSETITQSENIPLPLHEGRRKTEMPLSECKKVTFHVKYMRARAGKSKSLFR